jgi:hypothetical protein
VVELLEEFVPGVGCSNGNWGYEKDFCSAMLRIDGH